MSTEATKLSRLIKAINNKIHAIKGVKKVEVFQHIKIKWIQDSLNEELDTKLHSTVIEIT
jgi:metal-sulfur cluster biosynthetic enzyme